MSGQCSLADTSIALGNEEASTAGGANNAQQPADAEHVASPRVGTSSTSHTLAPAHMPVVASCWGWQWGSWDSMGRWEWEKRFREAHHREASEHGWRLHNLEHEKVEPVMPKLEDW